MDRFEQGLPVYRALLLTDCFFVQRQERYALHIILLDTCCAAAACGRSKYHNGGRRAASGRSAHNSADVRGQSIFLAPFCNGHSDTSPILFRVIVAPGADSKSTPSIKILSFPAPKCVHPYGKQAAAPITCGCRCQFVLGGACNRKIRRNGAPAALIPPFRL